MIGVGFLSLGCLLVAEWGLTTGLLFHGLAFEGYRSSHDVMSRSVYIVLFGLLGFMPLLVARTVKREGREIPKLWSKAERALASLGLGLILTALYHGFMVLAWTLLHLSDQSLLVQVMLAPGIVLVARGFENQVLIPFANGITFFLAFTYLSWMYLGQSALRKSTSRAGQ
jgi:hypothetical protein